jgi:hypothetical protein
VGDFFLGKPGSCHRCARLAGKPFDHVINAVTERARVRFLVDPCHAPLACAEPGQTAFEALDLPWIPVWERGCQIGIHKKN